MPKPGSIAIFSWKGSVAGPSTVNLTVNYYFVPSTVIVFTGTYKFLDCGATLNASLNRGESLLSMYYVMLSLAM